MHLNHSIDLLYTLQNCFTSFLNRLCLEEGLNNSLSVFQLNLELGLKIIK